MAYIRLKGQLRPSNLLATERHLLKLLVDLFERVNRRRYATIAEARQDVFDYIERFHNPRVRRRIQANDNALPLTQPSAKTG